MEKQAIVKELLSRGIMVTPETLERMKTGGHSDIIRQAGSGTVLRDGQEEKLKCRLKITERPPQLTPEDAIKASRERYERIRKMLLGKVDAVSIHNIRRTTAKLCVVGQVREKKDGGFLLEDGTGEIRVQTKEDAEPGDVIAVKGWIRENVLYGEEIVYPGIPINREINVMDGTLLLTREPEERGGTADIILTPDMMMGEGKERRMPNPAWVFLERGGKRATVLVYSPDRDADKETVVSWLSKRYIGSDKGPITDGDKILDEIPDIVWIINGNGPWAVNYKGVTIISPGLKKQALVDLHTRKVKII
jgi:hypothetical protein